MVKYQNKYRIESARLKDWAYRNAGTYFITICTKNKQHFFGKCQNDKMKLSTIGLIIQGCWFEIPRLNHQVRLGEFIVMPNHIHGILILDEMDRDDDVETLQCNVSTNPKIKFFSNISPKSGSVSRILGSFKSACSYHINRTFPNLDFKWQERFHDHIIRNEASLGRISHYIINNPKKWATDKFNNENQIT